MERCAATLLILVCLAIGFASAEQARAPAPSTAARLDTTIARRWTGDLDEMIERRLIRVLLPYSKTHYFIDKGVQRGVTYDALKQFESELNSRLKTRNLPVQVVFLPTPLGKLQAALLEGRGDIAVANVTRTADWDDVADFAAPTSADVKEVVVTGPGASALASVDDLAGQTVQVREQSAYRESLMALNAQLTERGKAPIVIQFVPDTLEDEDILEMVNAGLIKITVVNDNTAAFWKQIFKAITVHEAVAIRTDGTVAMAIRKGSPKLKAELDAFVTTHGQQSAFGSATLRRYFQSTRYVKNARDPDELAKFHRMTDLFRKYADRYDIDWLLMISQGYQESALDQNAKSKVGAIGVMQLMPQTGKEMNVGDIALLEPNIHAGIKYFRSVVDRNFKDEPMETLNKGLFAFASYNAGPGRIHQLRAEAERAGFDPNVWFNNVELIAAKRIGRETVQYVSNIYKYYVAYTLAYSENRRDGAAASARGAGNR